MKHAANARADQMHRMPESRCYRIAGLEFAEVLEVRYRLGAERPAPSPRPSRNLQSIRRGRHCYDRFAVTSATARRHGTTTK